MKTKSFLILLAIVIMISSCSNEQPVISIAGNNWIGYQPFYAIDEETNKSIHSHDVHEIDKHSNFNHNIRFTRLPSTSTVLRLLTNGSIDAGFLTLDEAIKLQSDTKLKLCTPLLIDYSNGADAMVSKVTASELKKHNELKVGYESTALGTYMMRRAIDYLELDENKIIPVTLEPQEIIKAYKSGKIDAIISFQPYIQEAVNIGGDIVFSSKDIPGEIIDLMVVTQEAWQNHSKVIKEIVIDEWDKSLKRVKQNDKKIMEIISINSELSLKELSNAYEEIHLIDSIESDRILKNNFTETVNHLARYLKEAGDIESYPDLTPCQ